jgi:outer membrane biogenesis lipoprotein LolB
MNGSTQNIQLPVILFVCICFFSACTSVSTRIPKTHAPSQAGAIVSTLKSQNHELTTFKGLGKIVFLGNEGKDIAIRIAWVASIPDRIRMTLTSVSGQPIISAATDGRWLYLISHAKSDFIKKRATDSNMKHFFSIAIKSHDVVDILAGRVPFKRYDSAALIEDGYLDMSSGEDFDMPGASSLKGNEHGDVLVLKDRWRNVLEKIYLDRRQDVQKIEMFDSTGALLYRVEFNQMQQINDYRVPSRLKVSNDDGQGFKLELDRYWAHARVSPSVFTLTPPK